MRWLLGTAIAALTVILLFLVGYLFFGDFRDADVDVSHPIGTSAAPEANEEPATSYSVRDAEAVFHDFGADVEGSNVTFPSVSLWREAAVFDCTGWDLTLDGFHARFVMVGECGSVTVLGTQASVVAESIDELVHDGTHATVVAGRVGEAQLDGAQGVIITESVDRLTGSASFPRLIVGEVGTDDSDFTFGTAIVGSGLPADRYADSSSPELLAARDISLPLNDGETRILSSDADEHTCSGESLVIPEQSERNNVAIYGSCGAVIVESRDRVYIEDATLIVVMISASDLEIGSVDSLVTVQSSGGDIFAQSVESLMNAGENLVLDTEYLGAVMSLEIPEDIVWSDGMDAEDAVLPEDADPLVGP